MPIAFNAQHNRASPRERVDVEATFAVSVGDGEPSTQVDFG